MPPPTVSDPWLASRRFGIVIDAGSSGSRLQIYSWKDPRTVRNEQNAKGLNALPTVEKGVREGEAWVSKVEPGLSSFAENPEEVASYLAPLLEHARTQVPPSLQEETPLFLLATAGMRLLNATRQARVLQETCNFFKLHSNFKIDEPSAAGPCGNSVRIITGEEEGLFGWIAVNYLMDGFTSDSDEPTTYGFLDMGGASTQIAFEPSKEEREKTKNLIDVRLRLLNGKEIHHEVFVTTWLGYGTNQARERYVGKTITEYESSVAKHTPDPSSTEHVIHDPCLPKDLRVTESPVQPSSAEEHQKAAHTFVGTGSFEQCLRQTSPLLNKDTPCPDTPCLFNGVRVPPIDFSASHFIGVSEYWYSSEHIFGLGGAYDVVQYERAAAEFCGREWSSIMREHEQSRQKGHLGGDGEVVQNGQVVGTGKWGAKVEISRLQMQCFKAAWIVNVLHEGIGLPRIVDPGGNSTTNGDKVAEQAGQKGLGRPAFQSMDSVGDIAISWTLGKMVIEASKEVPPLSPNTRPLGDPLDDIPESSDFPIKPIRPFLDFDAIEDHISHRLPPYLTRHSLGFSPIAFLFYVIVVCVFLSTAYRLRHRIRASLRRCIRKRDRQYLVEDYSMEEGRVLNGSPQRPSSPASRLFSKLFDQKASGSRSLRPSPLHVQVHANGIGPMRSGQISPHRISPIHRSFSYPTPKSPVGVSNTLDLTLTNGSATSYVPGSPRLHDGSIVSNGSVASLTSRSRNSSRLDLSSVTPRQAISRSNSGLPSVI